MDKTFRQALSGELCGDLLTGNRPFSILRIKLALRYLEKILGTEVLKERDHLSSCMSMQYWLQMMGGVTMR